MKALLIDSKTQTIQEIQIQKFEELYKLIGCELVEAIRLGKASKDGNEITMWVDEEGLLNTTNDSTYFALLNGSKVRCMISGKAVIACDPADQLEDSDDFSELPEMATVEAVSRFVKFIDVTKSKEAGDIVNKMLSATTVCFNEHDLLQVQKKNEQIMSEVAAIIK